jgi:SanA protein
MGFVRTIRFLGFWFVVAILLVVVLIAPAVLMRVSMTPYFYTDIADIPSTRTALVLGASVIRGKPSPALEARVETAKELYRSGKVDVVLVTGSVDGSYDEITPMREYLIAAGIPERDIASDSAGFNTFTSMYRARNTFLADSLIVVTQDFHLPRALFLARALDMRAYGLTASRGGKLYDYLREIPASWKALWDVLMYRNTPTVSALSPLIIHGVSAR